MNKPQRRDYRAEIPPSLILDLALWPADGLAPGAATTPATLGDPLLRRDTSRAYSLHLTNLSASGMNLRIHNRKLNAAKARAFSGRRFLIRLVLDDEGGPLSLLLLAEARRADALDGAITVAFEFIARTRYVKALHVLQLFTLRGRGVDRLASWISRTEARGQEAPPALLATAWYEALD